eukprot:gnl/MRDRNA2_/MRDRNA2_97633_c0_seq1.p1 gnl/MRDRNA2_/MRDRNA2_97633_c0~~gnl/MRDRNA2_/MRDRNA2_97633_c0_seq1.p1  ORF type:complete len:279 (+),score=52.18 gnl/MRDRNA2_/MRDRNA2_97633_c0_seq1:66-902(+)
MNVGLLLFGQRKASDEGGTADMLFEIGDENSVVWAHTLVICAVSPVLSAQLRGKFEEAQEKRIKLPDVELKCFEDFLRLVYMGEKMDFQDMHVDNILEVAILADRYGLSGFSSLLVDALDKKCMWGENVGWVLASAFRFPESSEIRSPLVEMALKKVPLSLSDINTFRQEMDSLDQYTCSEKLKSKLSILKKLQCNTLASMKDTVTGNVTVVCHSTYHPPGRQFVAKGELPAHVEQKAILEHITTELGAILSAWDELPEVGLSSKRRRLSESKIFSTS